MCGLHRLSAIDATVIKCIVRTTGYTDRVLAVAETNRAVTHIEKEQ